MNVMARAMLLTGICGAAALCQSNPSPDPEPSSGTRGFATVSATSHAIEPFALGTYKGSSSAAPTLLRFDSAATQASATYSLLKPFRYTIADDRLDYFPVKLGPLRYTFWPRTSQINRAAGGRLQKLVDGVRQHYTSNPVIPANERCLRSLTCNSLYEQAVRRRAVPSTIR